MMFNSDIYVGRRKLLSEKIGSGLILFWGNDESPVNYPGNHYYFRQHSSFLYYFGLDRPSLAAIIDIDNQKEIIFGDDYSSDDQIWMGPQSSVAEISLLSGIEETQPTVKLYTLLKEAQAARRDIHFLPPYRPENKIKLLRFLNIRPDQVNLHASSILIRAVVSQRELKSPEEVIEIEKAVDLSVGMHLEAMRFVRPGLTEAQVAGRVFELAVANNSNLAFPAIATIKGQVLQKNAYRNTLKEGDLFVLDAGADSPMHYASDLSSTFPVGKEFSPIQKEIYLAELKAFELAVSLLASGVNFKDIHLATCKSIAGSMKQMGLMKGDIDEAVAEGAHALFFPGGVGHLMGLDVHDMEDMGEMWVGYEGEQKSTQFGLKSLRLAKPLRAGHVLAVEPGVYFIPHLIDLWRSEHRFDHFLNWNEIEKFKAFGGVRLEENFLITESVCRRLGASIPKTIEDIMRAKVS